MGDSVVTDQLRRGALGGEEHVDGCRVVPLLGVTAGEIQADLAAAARQASRKALQVKHLAGLHGRGGVTERHSCGDLVNADVGGPECCPAVVPVRAEPLGDPPRRAEGLIGGRAVEFSSGGERAGQMQAAEN